MVKMVEQLMSHRCDGSAQQRHAAGCAHRRGLRAMRAGITKAGFIDGVARRLMPNVGLPLPMNTGYIYANEI
jgi:hypothetical protein